MSSPIIPHDVIIYLAKFVDQYTINSIALTCKYFHKFLTDRYEKPWHVEIGESSNTPHPFIPMSKYSIKILLIKSGKIHWDFLSTNAYVYKNRRITIYRFVKCKRIVTTIYHKNKDNFAFYNVRIRKLWLQSNFIAGPHLITMKSVTKITSAILSLMSEHGIAEGHGPTTEYQIFKDRRKYTRLDVL